MSSENTDKMERALEFSEREFTKHSGPQSDEHERATFGRDLRNAALRFARAYYAEARELGLIPEYELKQAKRWSGPVDQRCYNCGSRFDEHVGSTDDCPEHKVME